ncbi:MAG: tripartite tricarboxylate transporter substrate binding protein [Betaproteobacteria bacterium]|nr:tripartite tricarboxylate transporter substrate binding protein [Betaproteobacteria bacterium]
MSVFVAAHAAGTDGAPASEYPVKPIRIVVGFSPGGGGDIVARIVAQKLSENLKQSMIVDNRPGAGGSIGAAFVARSAPDGYTLLVVTSSYAVIPSLYKELSFDPIRDLAAVSLIAEAPLLVVVHPSLPVHAIRELIAFAKARPGQLNYASGGSGTSGNLAGELFKSLAGVNIVHVPYKGAGPALVDVISGQVHMNFVSMLSSLPHVKSGKLRALAVTGVKRSAALPQLPTVAEAGVKGYRRTTWYGVLAPAHTPAAIINKLSRETAKAVNSPDIRQRFMTDGAEPEGGTPKEFHDYLVSEIALARKIIEQAGVPK